MFLYQARKLLAFKDKNGVIWRTTENYRTYDAACRKDGSTRSRTGKVC